MITDIKTSCASAKEFISKVSGIHSSFLRIGNGINNYIIDSFLEDSDDISCATETIIYEISQSPFVLIQQRTRKPFHSCQSGQAISYTRILPIDSSTTLKDLHLLVYTFVLSFAKEFKFSNFEEIIANQKIDFHSSYTLNFVNKNIGTSQLCPYCLINCNNCQVEYSEQLLSDFIEKTKGILILEILWSRSIPGEIVNKLNLIKKHNTAENTDKMLILANSSPIKLYECIEEFSKIEKLDFNNRMFCSTCKAFTQGKKKMEI